MLAKGLNFQIGAADGPPETFNQILNCTEISFAGTSWQTETVTSHNSTTPVEEIVSTIRQDGTVSLTISPFLPNNTQHALLRTLSTTGTARNYKVTYPGSSIGTFTLSGFVQSFAPELPVDGIYKATVVIQPVAAILDQPASITSVTVTDSEAGAYETDEDIILSVAFDEVVTVSGTPRIEIVLDSGSVFAEYDSGTLTNVLSFVATFGGGDQADAGEVSIESPVQLNSGTIKDMAGNNAVLTFTPPDTSLFVVNPS